MMSWYERYGVWVTLAFFVTVCIASLVGFSPIRQVLQSVCSPSDKGDCFRQWVSATSGWFGGAVTFATLVFLSRQVNDIRMHHRETMMHATRPIYLRAKRIKEAVWSLRYSLDALRKAIDDADKQVASPIALFAIMAALRGVQQGFSRPDLDNFESDIGYIGIGSALSLRQSLEPLISLGEIIANGLITDPKRPLNAARFADFKESAVPHEIMESYLSGITEQAEKYIAEWERKSYGVA
ncbi:hypothetical protein [Rhizobium leguminosarum]|uniref:hypothetical protein n=1 Tax=Rhizobium leguminosarum TaxID=384 RepID=UPI001C94F9DC|nr:hypothetical protein [Rhizobium leguminosarum]MBY5709729.1 hypothetical protein [Rhizobium leguminosarum]